MMLLFDLGNSRIKIARWHDGRIVQRLSIPHSGQLPVELLSVLDGMPAPETVLGCHVASEELAAALDEALTSRWALRTRWMRSTAEQGGLRNAYPQPELLGVDRWMAMLGALELGLQPCCIVDCGTAVTVDVVDAAGRHQGGLIFAGLALSRQALSQRAHRLSDAGEGELPLLATETLTAIRSGTFHGLAAAISGLFRGIQDSRGDPLQLVLTGGDAQVLAPALTGCSPRLEPDLVFHGLLRAAREPEG
ncbi:MAG: type III pantothenate kinase [Ectothiorhodospiraceae bacterium]|nr:type III pantothenate kinase [Ectothiorhodospiraceae bacterium]